MIDLLPLNERWYRRLLTSAIGLGIAAGFAALAYSMTTNAAIDRLFGSPSVAAWTGRWWWMLLVPVGAISVTALRPRWSVPDQVPGAVEYARRGWIEPKLALPLFAISAISLMTGASYGPSFGVVVAGGGLGAWLAKRRSWVDKGDGDDYSLTGMAGGLGAIFSAPLFSTILASELSSTPKKGYVAAFIPQFTAATFGWLVFFGVTGSVMLNSFSVDGYEYANTDLLWGVVLGALAIVTLVVFVIISKLTKRVAAALPNRWIRATVAGLLIGIIAFALPLTATGGSTQLQYVTSNAGTFSAGLLAAVLVAKMFAVAASEEAGFLGGTVFPMLFIGGIAGLLVSTTIPSIPIPLAVACMIAAVAGASISAPVGFILIASGGVGLGVDGIAPIGIAVATSYVCFNFIMLRISARREPPETDTSQ